MGRVRILTDSTSDIPADLADRLGIVVVPAYVQMEGQSLRDGEQITRAEFYRRLPGLKGVPTTSVPPAHEFAAAFRSLIGQADEVVALTVSSNLSGMFDVAQMGSREVPELRVHVVDSGQLTMGLGWLVIVAAEEAAAGKSAAEILALVETLRPRVRVLAVLDTVENLRRSGRVNLVHALAANLLRIKPLIEVRQGVVSLVGRVRTRHKAIDWLLEQAAALMPLQRLAVIHTEASEVESFRSRLGALFPVEQIVISEVGPTVGTHVGPGALGIAAIVGS